MSPWRRIEAPLGSVAAVERNARRLRAGARGAGGKTASPPRVAHQLGAALLTPAASAWRFLRAPQGGRARALRRAWEAGSLVPKTSMCMSSHSRPRSGRIGRVSVGRRGGAVARKGGSPAGRGRRAGGAGAGRIAERVGGEPRKWGLGVSAALGVPRSLIRPRRWESSWRGGAGG
jgi:hypothetical protein